MTDEITKYHIPSWNIEALHKKINQLNKRANKIGCPPINIVEHGTERLVHPNYYEAVYELGTLKKEDVPHYTVHIVSIEGEGPKLAGWKFIGTLDHTTIPGSVIVNTVPGEKVPEQFYHNDAVCDHCGKIRRRTETFVVEHDEGEMRQVGRNCIRDFLGHDPKGILRLLTSVRSLISSLEDDDSDFYSGSGGRVDDVFDKEAVLRVTNAMIHTYGWTSRRQAEIEARGATADDVMQYFYPPRDAKARADWEKWKNKIQFTDEDEGDAKAALVWLEEQKSDTEYFHNLQTLAHADAIPSRMFGYWCSLMATYQRAMERLRQAERTQKLNEYVGEVKERRDFRVEIVGVRHIDGYYGVVHLYKMLDNAGRTLVWFANTDAEMSAGHKYLVKGTIKKHDEYNGWKQTILSRVKVLENIDE